MRKNAFNFVLFLFLAGVMFFLYQQVEKNLPKQEVRKNDAKPAAAGDQNKDVPKGDEPGKKDAEPKGSKEGPKDQEPKKEKEPPKVQPPSEPFPPTLLTLGDLPNYLAWLAPRVPPEPPTLIPLGDDSCYNRVLLTTRGGGVQQVVLPKFDQADRLGREVKERDRNGAPTRTPVPLHLIPGVPQPRGKFLSEDYDVPALAPGNVDRPELLSEPCYTLFHYATPQDKYPEPLLGERNWKVVSQERPKEGAAGEYKVAFETELGAPYFVKFRKTYTLAPKAYHVGLLIEIEGLPGAKKGKDGEFRYQLSGPRGLPIEGEWYTTTFRNAIIGWKTKEGKADRQIEDGASVAVKRGGDRVDRSDGTLQYAVVSTQYFASGVVVNDRFAEAGAVEHPAAYMRATTEVPAERKLDPAHAQFDDVTVRVASEALNLGAGERVAHSFLIYNGPAKVGLLDYMPADRAVDQALVERYQTGLGLRTITDFHSDTVFGRFLSRIGWSGVVIGTTNLMHAFLARVHWLIDNWALSIVVLTAVVRLLLLYPSRKQTAMNMRMMEVQKALQPEFDKLREKYKDDLGEYNRQKMRLMMSRGVNPAAQLGGCLLLFAQAPIMTGLYFCLQESIFFRLDRFLWIDNLAAPDMLFSWGEGVPFISRPEDMGSFIYLGPYFNLLPLLAVGLMMYQQAKMLPPSNNDPQVQSQRTMMKFMMVMMAFFFYKVAAGLALYFIVSTAWAIVERQFVPKPRIDPIGDGPGGAALIGKPMTAAEAAAAAAKKTPGRLGRLREALRKKVEEMQKRADEQSKRQIRNEPGGGAGNGAGGAGPAGPGGPNRRNYDKKKRRKK